MKYRHAIYARSVPGLKTAGICSKMEDVCPGISGAGQQTSKTEVKGKARLW